MEIKNELFNFDKNFVENYLDSNSDFQAGVNFLIGTDEAGRGPGAGGVFASAVYFPNPTFDLIGKLSGLNDSKKLSKAKREELYEIIVQNSINSTVCIEVAEIEKINILNASLKAMKLACNNVISDLNFQGKELNAKTVFVLVDGNKLIKDFAPSIESLHTQKDVKNSNQIFQKYIIKGDSKSASIAAASILAKVTRDRYMQELDKKFPQYGWAKNAGYLTKTHLDAIDQYGLTPIHRKSFLKKHFEKQLNLF